MSRTGEPTLITKTHDLILGSSQTGMQTTYSAPMAPRKPFEFCRRFLGVLSALATQGRDSAKTYGNLVHRTACRKTDEFPVPAWAVLIGRLRFPSENVRVGDTDPGSARGGRNAIKRGLRLLRV